MRSFVVDLTPILPLFDTGCSPFALWVRATKDEVPNAFLVQTKSESAIGIWVQYPRPIKKTIVVKVNDLVQVYLNNNNGNLAGFDLPLKKFRSHLKSLVMWLREQVGSLNNESTRVNYRLITTLLHSYADELFLPPQ